MQSSSGVSLGFFVICFWPAFDIEVSFSPALQFIPNRCIISTAVFLRIYYGLSPDTNGDAIVYYCDLKKSYLGISTKFDFFLLISFFFLLLSLPLPPPLPSLLLHLSLPLWFPTLGRGRISCSEVGWFLGGARRPESGLPPDTRRWNAGQEGPYARTELAARRHQESNPKGEPEGASPGHWASGLPKGQRTPATAHGGNAWKWSWQWLPWRPVHYYC